MNVPSALTEAAHTDTAQAVADVDIPHPQAGVKETLAAVAAIAQAANIAQPPFHTGAVVVEDRTEGVSSACLGGRRDAWSRVLSRCKASA